MSTWPSETKTALLLPPMAQKFMGTALAPPDTHLARLFQYRNVRLSGNHYRPFLCQPDCCFHLPHIGNVGVNPADIETSNTNKAEAARGLSFANA